MIKKTRLALFGIAVLAALPARADTPRRVVSFNLCADQLLLTLADDDQIAGLSPYALDSSLSVMTDKAARFPRSDWTAESVVTLAPDLVLAGPSDRPTRALLSATGLRVVEIDLVSTLDAARKQVRDVGIWLGHPERGDALAQQLAQAEQDLRSAALKAPRTATVVQREGYVEGANSLVASMLSAAGLKPPDNAVGGFGGFVSMETLLTRGPDILVLQDNADKASDQGALFLTHPALLARYGADKRIQLPSRYTLCGGPSLLEGLKRLREAISGLR